MLPCPGEREWRRRVGLKKCLASELMGHPPAKVAAPPRNVVALALTSPSVPLVQVLGAALLAGVLFPNTGQP